MNKSTKLCQHGNTGEICRVPKCCNPAENAAMISAVIAANLLCVWQSYLERYFSVPQPKQSVPQGEVVTGNGIVDVETQHPHSRCGNPAVLVFLLNGKVENQFLLVVLPKPDFQLKIVSIPQIVTRKW